MQYRGSLLVVDDDKHICAAMADYLRSLGHRAETATTCSQALARVREFNFEVVVCDVNLGDQDGFQVLEWIVQNKPETAVILITGYGTIESAVEAIRMGAFDYLTKPVIDDELWRLESRKRNSRSKEIWTPGASTCYQPPASP